ncbi:hypothetical protein HZC08_02345 [Candidatus Micrarchaeota archaeon]|nr:hypothetical protein [Candidatus Micrarchaeota archaeon]
MPSLKDLTIEIQSAFRKRNQKKLRKLNDKVMKMGVMEFNQMLYDLAVISYILSKIVSKPRFLDKKYEKEMILIDKTLSSMVKSLSNGCEDWKQLFSTMQNAISSLEKEDPRFLTNLVSKGKLKVASILYAQGLSLGTASEYTGMTKQDILDYAGKTMMFDRVKEEKSIMDRLKFARKFIEG